MRYIELIDGSIVMSTRRAMAHKDLLTIARKSRDEVASAGFLGARYSPEDSWNPHGKSIGLNLASNPELQIPSKLWVGRVRYGLVYATRPELLQGAEQVEEATWGMTAEGSWGDCPVYAPYHSKYTPSPDELLRD